jgi:hypothetical protein
MARCSRCEAKIGMFENTLRRADATLCESCLTPWYKERKQESLQFLCEGGEPVEFFSIPLVQCVDPYIRNGQNLLIGNLAFTDKGICFIQIGEYPETFESKGAFPFFLALVGITLICSDIYKDTAIKKQAIVQGQLAVLENAKSFTEILQRSPKLIVFAREQVSDVTFGRRSGLLVHLGKQKMCFYLKGKQKEFEQHSQGIEQFLDVMRNYRQSLPMQWPMR